MRPSVIFVVTGVLWLTRSLASFGDPAFTDPESAFDWFSVFSFSAALASLALALVAFAQLVGGRATGIAAAVAAAGAAIGSLANIVEDGLRQGWAGVALYFPGVLLMLLGIVALTIAVAASSKGAARLLAAIPATALLGMLNLEVGGGVLVLAAWIAAAVVAERRARAPAILPGAGSAAESART
jgi:hypothetical protein